MGTEDVLIADAADYLSRKAALPAYDGLLARSALESWVAQHILSLIQQNQFDTLLQVCYRVDVAEAAVHRAFEQREPSGIAAELARMLVDRELQKAESRRKYRENPT